ncbi:hypothetical protein [Actinomadura opuntiae]|uniref:hypothetical protein n=1 Tax=Actinomadura sp. OS1-43 TaxID=604315 RepID=UPI00255AF9AB|nr:hypothetical protein [Actinomadura sp. OS1-43]MDL4815997.1 hypothetical protein [Actinomadura sp. OS1-43]
MSTYNFPGGISGAGHHFGDGGQHVHHHRTSDLGPLVRELRRQISAATPPLPSDVDETAEQLEAELENENPNPGRLRRLIEQITTAAAATTAIAGAAEQVAGAIQHI